MLSAQLASSPDDPRLLRNLALAHKNISGTLCTATRDYQACLDHANKAAEIDSRLLAAKPADPQAQLDYAIDLSSISAAYDYMGNAEQAITYMQRSLDMREKIVAASPSDARTTDRLAYALSSIAEMRTRSGKNLDLARRDALRAYRLYEKMYAGGNRHAQTVERFALCSSLLARFADRDGHSSTGCSYYRKWVSLYQELEKSPGYAESVDDSLKRQVREVRRRALACGP